MRRDPIASIVAAGLAGFLFLTEGAWAQGNTIPEAPPAAPRLDGPLPSRTSPLGSGSDDPGQSLPTSVGDAVGTWELALVSGGRSCTLTLTGDSGPNGRVAQVPGACRRAIPILQGVAGWLFGDGGVRLVDRNIRPLLQFLPSENGRHFVAKAGGRSYMMTPVQLGDTGPAAQPPTYSSPTASAPMTASPPPAAMATSPMPEPSLRGEMPATIPDIAAARPIPGSQPVLPANTILRPEEAPPAAPPPVSSPVSRPSEPAQAGAAKAGSDRPLPGTYALDRFTEKDVCRIALEPRPASLAAAPDTTLAPARVLPGCRDSGITVFEPISWRFANGHMTLKAKRGHSINLIANGEGGWRRDPDVGTTFVLRKVEP